MASYRPFCLTFYTERNVILTKAKSICFSFYWQVLQLIRLIICIEESSTFVVFKKISWRFMRLLIAVDERWVSSVPGHIGRSFEQPDTGRRPQLNKKEWKRVKQLALVWKVTLSFVRLTYHPWHIDVHYCERSPCSRRQGIYCRAVRRSSVC